MPLATAKKYLRPVTPSSHFDSSMTVIYQIKASALQNLAPISVELNFLERVAQVESNDVEVGETEDQWHGGRRQDFRHQALVLHEPH